VKRFLAVTTLIIETAGDPADSWLTYAKASDPKGSRIVYFYAETVVPQNPADSGGVPAFWIGIEPRPAYNLIQPIIPQWLYGTWYIFVEQYDWNTGNNFDSSFITVQPGQKIYGEVQYVAKNNSYLMTAGIVGGKKVSMYGYVDKNQTFTDAYVVLEHQPYLCAEFPPDNSITYDNIRVIWESGSTKPAWTSNTFMPACASATNVISATEVELTWQS
jgi:hypothetical protein